MNIKLLKIDMKNTKGVKEFTFIPDGNNSLVSGDNKTGKTTIFDAFLWCLFDMDSFGRKGAEAIKTTDKTEYKHNLEHDVTVKLSIDGKDRTYRKVLTEKWIKPQGKPDKKLTGNTNDYWIDDNPVSQAEYNDDIKTLVPQSFKSVFKDQLQFLKILTDPLYFGNVLDWHDRLDVLIAMAGKATTDEICRGDKELEAFIEQLGDLSTDKYKDKINLLIRNLNDELKKIPPVINELNNSIKGLDESMMRPLDTMIEKVESTIKKCDEEMLNAAEANKPVIAAQRELIRLQGERDNILRRLANDANADRNVMSAERVGLVTIIRDKEQSIKGLKASNESILNQKNATDKVIIALREQWGDVEKKRIETVKTEFIPPDFDSLVCDKCGQKLPDENIQERITAAGAEFDRAKKNKLDDLENEKAAIKQRGEGLKKSLAEYEEQMRNNSVTIEDDTKVLMESRARLEEVATILDTTSMWMPVDFAKSAEVIELDCRIMETTALTNITVDDQALDCYQRKQKASEELKDLHQQLFTRNSEIQKKDRIKELEDEDKDLNRRKVISEGLIYLCERYIREKTRASENKINDMFTEVSFKLFKEQVNGETDETCEAVVGETTFSKANTAAQVNAGLDIINTISEFYEIRIPVFVDRIESNLHLYDIKSQYIKLEVQPHDLTVEKI